jgi:hypothetical protein
MVGADSILEVREGGGGTLEEGVKGFEQLYNASTRVKENRFVVY